MRESIGDLWLGIDLGTQSVRAIVVSSDGRVLSAAVEKLQSHRNENRHEQSPYDWRSALWRACRSAMANVPLESVRGVAVDGTSGTILLVDHKGTPLSIGLMYDDARGAKHVDRADEVGARIWRSLGYRMQASWALPKLLWLVEQYPYLLKGARLSHQTDYINELLAGAPVATDSSSALKTGYDLLHNQWPADVFDSLGIPFAILPKVVRPGTQIGVVCDEASESSGIPKGTPVIAGMTDGCASQISAGAVNVGQWNSVLGTTLVLKGVTEDLIRDPNGIVYSHRSPEGHWLPGGASNVGAGFVARDFAGQDLDALSREAAERGVSRAVVYPLVTRGERFPFVLRDAVGFSIGEPVDEVDRFAAHLQGVGFVERLCFDYLSMLNFPADGDLMLTGGGAKNRIWCQWRADILNRQVRIPESAEAAVGMAILAASNVSGASISELAAKMVRIRDIIEPRESVAREFVEPYLKLVDELHRRGWIDSHLADHAHRRAGR